jgi:5-hydroxyisourate hydrolase-like protein (transthyretin family)
VMDAAENFGRSVLSEGMRSAERGDEVTSGGRRLELVWRLSLTAAIVYVVFAAFAPRADANYSVRECNSAVGNSDAAMIRPFGAATKIGQTDTCGGWGLRMEANGQSTYNTYVVWQWTAPPNTIFKTAQTQLHYYTDGGYGPMTSGSGTPGYSGVGSPGNFWVTPVQSNSTFYAIYERCFANPCSSNSAFAYITDFYAEVQDLAAPRVGASGELFDGGVVSGVQTVNATVGDTGGGVRSIAVYVNGIPSSYATICGPDIDQVTYSHLKPCPDSSGPRAIQLDTEHGAGWVNGSNEVRICGYDVGGNQSPCLQRTVMVDNSCAPSGGSAATSLDSGADVGGQLRRRAQLTSNDIPVVRGILSDAAGHPVAGAAVCVYQTTQLPDAGRELATTVTTQANGRFATRLDAGPSRTVDLVYRFNTKKLTDRVELDSKVVPTLAIPDKHLTNGQAATFFGRLPGPNAEGRAVALQARVGRKWRTFKQVQTGDGGRFRGKYRFTQTVGRVRYVFRALVKGQSGYPYDPGASRQRKLVVRG